MNTHLMIVHPRYLGPILTRQKTIEARLGVDRRAPFDRVSKGDLVYIKPTSQQVAAKARVYRVDQFEDLTPDDVIAMRETYDDRILGGDLYWDAKLESRYATLITLERPTLIQSEAGIPSELLAPSRNAWRVASDQRVRRAA